MEILNTLKELFSNYDWFYDVGLDEFNKPVVYVHHMNTDIFNIIRKESSVVKIYYSSYAKLKASNYIEELNAEPDLDHLNTEIRYLQSICKRDLLQHVFYEIHDGDNAVTNYSSALSEVREMLEDLYNTYGYDLLYEKLES